MGVNPINLQFILFLGFKAITRVLDKRPDFTKIAINTWQIGHFVSKRVFLPKMPTCWQSKGK